MQCATPADGFGEPEPTALPRAGVQSVDKMIAESALEATPGRAKMIQDLVVGFRAGLVEHFREVRRCVTPGSTGSPVASVDFWTDPSSPWAEMNGRKPARAASGGRRSGSSTPAFT